MGWSSIRLDFWHLPFYEIIKYIKGIHILFFCYFQNILGQIKISFTSNSILLDLKITFPHIFCGNKKLKKNFNFFFKNLCSNFYHRSSICRSSIWRSSICRSSIWRSSICRSSICRSSICRSSICRSSKWLFDLGRLTGVV